MATYRDRGIVLRAKSLRDDDRHYVLYTREHGKIVLLAKGSRKGKSKMSPHMGALGVVDVMVAKGRIIDRLAGAEMVGAYRSVALSLEKTALAQAVLLTVDAMTKRELPDERVFALLVEWLEALDAGPDEGATAGRSLLFDAAVSRLMDALGLAIDLRSCVRCRTMLVPEGNAVNVIQGGIECRDCREQTSAPISADAIKALRFLRGGPLDAVPLLRLDGRTRREVGFVTELLLTTHVEERFNALRYLRAVA